MSKPEMFLKEEVQTTTAETLPLRQYVSKVLENYFSQLDGQKPVELYTMVQEEVEIPLFEAVMAYTRGNQCKAADILGISRGTLRKKLKIYKLEKNNSNL